jgi:hypothetical protein
MQFPYHANPDQVAVAVILLPANFSESHVKVKVRNTNNNFVSDSLPLRIDSSDPDAPYAEGLPYGGIRRGEEKDFTLSVQNLDGAWLISGIHGVTCSIIQTSCCEISFHVKADPDASVTGDEVTNLTISTSKGHTNQFNFPVDPPP